MTSQIETKASTARGKRLVAAGYRVTREVRTRTVYSRDWLGNPALTGSWQTGKWYEVTTPDGMDALVGYQSASCIHVFYTFEGTASGTTEATAHKGGLGDAIDTDAQLKGYRKLVLSAPKSLLDKYTGLYRASSDAYNG
jgi:hypothetical protein